MSSASSSENQPWLLRFDGGSIGNPGPSAGAAILVRTGGEILRTSRFLEHATNNQAEYAGFLCGLILAKETGARRLQVEGDSKLVICQFNGEWRVKDPTLKECLAEVKALAGSFAAVEASWIPREENTEADAEVRRCLEAAAPTAAVHHASFQELAKLRVGGSDQFSRMKREALLVALGSEGDIAVTIIDRAFAESTGDREKLALMALRWTARGLSPTESAQKVLVDLEIGRQAAKRRGSGARR